MDDISHDTSRDAAPGPGFRTVEEESAFWDRLFETSASKMIEEAAEREAEETARILASRFRAAPPRRRRLTAQEAEAMIAAGRSADQVTWSELGGHEWADVEHGDCAPVRGQVKIADLITAGRNAHAHAHEARDADTWVLT